MKIQNLIALPAVVASFAMVSAVDAAAVFIANSSFEEPVIPNDPGSVLAPKPSGTFNGWNYFMSTGSEFQDFGIENPNAAAYTDAGGNGQPLGADGSNVAFLNQGIGSGVINIFQDVGALLPNTTYTLTVAVGQRLDRVNGTVEIAMFNAVLGESNVWTNGSYLNSTLGISNVSGSFQDFAVTFTTGGVVADQLYIGAQYVGDGTVQASIDNFRLDAIPEPATSGLMLVAGLGLLARRRRA